MTTYLGTGETRAVTEPITLETLRTKSFVRVLANWKSYALWLAGRVATDNVDGRALGLSEGLVEDLDSWALEYDSYFNEDDPGGDWELPNDYLERGYRLAERVRAELGEEWTVTARSPDTAKEVEVEPLP
jgi:hypothetical protein